MKTKLSGASRNGISACVSLLLASVLLLPARTVRAADVDSAALNQRIDDLQSQLDALSRSSASKQEIGLPIHGYSNIDYVHDSLHADGKHDGFALGNFDLYMLPSFGSRLRGLVELNFEYDGEGGLNTDLERLELGYTFSDAATLWVGRFHTPYGFWNTAFHHGVQMQLSTVRPRFVDFEDAGGILPAHTVGAQLSGHWRAGGGKFGYDAYVGNGDDIMLGNAANDGVLDFNAYKDRNGKKLVGINGHYAFGGALDGLTLGLHGYQDEVGTYDADGLVRSTRVRMTGFYGVYESSTWQAIGEYYHFNDADQLNGGGSFGSSAWFVQAGYGLGVITPYGRVEKTTLNQNDHYFADQTSGRSYRRQAIGVRYDLNHNVAFKTEWYHTKDEAPAGDVSWDALRLQAAVSF